MYSFYIQILLVRHANFSDGVAKFSNANAMDMPNFISSSHSNFVAANVWT